MNDLVSAVELSAVNAQHATQDDRSNKDPSERQPIPGLRGYRHCILG